MFVSVFARAQSAAGITEQVPCQPHTQVSDGPFSFGVYVFFDPNSAILNARAHALLDAVLDYARKQHISGFVLNASVDSAEHAQRDHDLDRRRAEAVRTYMMQHGFNGWNVHYLLLDNAAAMVPTKPGVAEAHNRNVQIAIAGYGPGPDSDRPALLCRHWVLEHCIGSGGIGRESACKSGIDYLVRGDNVSIDLDWRTKYIQ